MRDNDGKERRSSDELFFFVLSREALVVLGLSVRAL